MNTGHNPKLRIRLVSLLAVFALLPSLASADVNRTYTYDAADQVIDVKESSITIAEHAYDGDGERVSKKTGGTEVLFVRGPSGQVLAEYDGTTGSLIAEYVYVNGHKVSRIAAGGTVTYYHNDHLGTPRAITNASGNVVWEGEYLPYGEEYISTGSREDNYTFTGHEEDFGLDLVYMHARYYSPEIGRFLSVDPVGGTVGNSQSWNRYAYVFNNPISKFDPNGKQVVEAVVLSTPPGAFAATSVVSAYYLDQSVPPEYRTSTFLTLAVALQIQVTQSFWSNMRRDARSRPGPQAQPDQGQRGREKIDRARGNKEKPPRDTGQEGDSGGRLGKDQPGADKPVPDPKAQPRGKGKRRLKALIDLVADWFSPSPSDV